MKRRRGCVFYLLIHWSEGEAFLSLKPLVVVFNLCYMNYISYKLLEPWCLSIHSVQSVPVSRCVCMCVCIYSEQELALLLYRS